MYEKPEITMLDHTSEGIYMASGSPKATCRFGRKEASKGVDMCQVCSYTRGAYSADSDVPEKSEFWYKGGKESDNGSYFKEDFTVCPDNMPIKN